MPGDERRRGETPPGRAGVSPHAVIVEDDALNAEVLATLLECYGVTCSVLSTPKGLDALLDSLPALAALFLDIELPGYDGFDVHRGLKDDPRLKGVPVVAYTVHTSQVDRARREGFHSFLGKPLKQEKFGAQLARILNNQPVWDP